MSRFFSEQVDRRQITLVGDNYHHLTHVLRAKLGERVTVCDGACTDYECTVTRIDQTCAVLEVEDVHPTSGEGGLHITLYQCLVKGEKMEQIISRAIEMGVERIVPVRSRYCIAKADAGKIERYRKIALSAAKQCGRGIVPCVQAPVDFADAVAMLAQTPNAFVCFENEREKTLLDFEISGDTVGFLIGPEGGLAPEEQALWRGAGVRSVSLGRRILRAENAAAFVLPVLHYKFGQF